MLNIKKKQDIINKYKISHNDTGSSNIQIAILTEKINQLQIHFKTHTHDFHSKHGLLNLISKRRKLLKYVQNKDIEKYKILIHNLKLRK